MDYHDLEKEVIEAVEEAFHRLEPVITHYSSYDEEHQEVFAKFNGLTILLWESRYEDNYYLSGFRLHRKLFGFFPIEKTIRFSEVIVMQSNNKVSKYITAFRKGEILKQKEISRAKDTAKLKILLETLAKL